MRTPALLRSLTSWGGALVLAGALGAALIGLHGLGFRWDPLGLAERRLQAAEAGGSAAAADAVARRFEVAYVERGARLVACENARASAVETLTAERALQDRWRRETAARRKPAIWPR